MLMGIPFGIGRAGGRRVLLAVTLCLALVGCGTTPPDAAIPARAEATQGSYQLQFELSKATWRTTEAIEGTATLSFSGTGSVTIWSSGSGPLNFGYVEVGGTRRMGPAWTADCVERQLSPTQPIISGLGKSGGFNGEDPNSSFYRSFFTDKDVHLSAGDWTITAIAEFMEGTCGGPRDTLQAAVQVHVTA